MITQLAQSGANGVAVFELYRGDLMKLDAKRTDDIQKKIDNQRALTAGAENYPKVSTDRAFRANFQQVMDETQQQAETAELPGLMRVEYAKLLSLSNRQKLKRYEAMIEEDVEEAANIIENLAQTMAILDARADSENATEQDKANQKVVKEKLKTLFKNIQQNSSFTPDQVAYRFTNAYVGTTSVFNKVLPNKAQQSVSKTKSNLKALFSETNPK